MMGSSPLAFLKDRHAGNGGTAKMNTQVNQTLLASLHHPALRDAFDALLLVLDRQGRIVAFNRACELSTGYREAEVRGRSFRFLVPDPQWENVRRALDDLFRGDTTSRHATTWLNRSGEERYIQWSGTLLRGEAEHLIITGIDVTGYRETLRSRLESDNRYRALVETSADVIWEVDTRWRYRYISSRIQDVLGYAPNDVIGHHIFDFVDADEAQRIRPLLEDFVRRQEPFRHFVTHRRHKSGREVILACSGTPFFDNHGALLGYRGIARDITDLHRTERRLRDSEQRLRLAQHLANIGSWEWHVASGEAYWSDIVWTLFGRDPEHFRPSYDNFLSTIHPADRDGVVRAIERCLDGGTTYDEEYRIVWPDGSVHWVRAIGNVVTGEDGRPERMLGVVMPIDARKEAEQHLQASERKYRFLIDNAADAIVLIDETATVVEANQRACELFGYARDEMIGLIAFALSAPDRRKRHVELFHEVLMNGGPVTEETWVHTQSGCRVPVEIRAARLRLEDGSLVQVIVRDITERREREAARLARERRQRNTLIREVHHRIKNNLQGILGLLHNQIHDDPALAASLAPAMRQIQSIALIHGIHGRREDGLLLLCEMLPAIVGVLPAYPDAHRGHTFERQVRQALAVAESEAVALALILGELLTNAGKHARDPARPVCVSLKTDCQGADIRIHSPGARLPEGFDLNHVDGSHTTGLELIRALMPQAGAQLTYRQTGDGVETRLWLEPPVVSPAQAECSDHCHLDEITTIDSA